MKKQDRWISPDHKVGIKILSDVQLMNVFPDYTEVLNHIEEHRSWLEKNQVKRFERYQYNLMFDNVISIFGQRGTGKTSVAFTLHKMLEDNEKHHYDVVLPIIIPEVIPEDGSVLGWLLAIIKDQVIDFERFMQSKKSRFSYDGYEDGYWRNCKIESSGGTQDSLSTELERLVELFHSAKYNPGNELSYNIAVGNSVKQSQNYYEFAKAIVTFWDHWIEKIRDYYSNFEHMEKEFVPLIFFVFDDVDLAPKKADELLSIIIKYLSHPNIMVITTADEEMFLEVIEERMDHDIGRLPKEWRIYLKSNDLRIDTENLAKDGSGELVRKTARRYLGKVMPTSTRYYLKLFNTIEEKRHFHLDEGKDLWSGICRQIQRLLECSKKNDNFLTMGNVDRDYYLYFLGNTSRQLGNAYIGIKDFIDSLIQKIQLFKEQRSKQDQQKLIEGVYHSTWRFLHISLNSAHDLAEQIEDVESFINEIFWIEHNEWFLYLNYEYIDEFLRKHTKTFREIDQIDMALRLYSLLHFTENIFIILESCTHNEITGRKKIHGLSYLREYLCEHVFGGKQLLRRNVSAEFFFAHYKTILNRIDRLAEHSLQDNRLSIEYFYDLTNEKSEAPKNLMLQAYRSDRDWLQEISVRLSAVYGNIYLIGKREAKICQIYESWEVLSGYQMLIQELLENEFHKALDEFNFLEAAQSGVQVAQKLIQRKMGKTDLFDQLINDYRKHFLMMLQIRENQLQSKKESNSTRLSRSTNRNRNSKTDNKKAPQRKLVPIFDIIKAVSDNLNNKNIFEILEILPYEESSDIKQRLMSEQNAKGVLSILQMLYNTISQWDNTINIVFIREMINLFEPFEDDDIDWDLTQELEKLAEYIYQFVPDEYDEYESNWYFIGGQLYKTIKERLNRVQYAYNRFQETSGERTTNMEAQLDRFKREIDGAVNLDDKSGFSKVVHVAVKVQLAIHIQRLYLYYSVIEKYNQEYIYSSKRIANPEFYYNSLFLQMTNLIKKEPVTLSKEENMIRRLITRSASNDKKNYIKSLLQEVKYESIQN